MRTGTRALAPPTLPRTGAVLPAGTAPPERTLVDILAETTAHHPHAPAIDDGQTVLDYQSLDEQIRDRGRRLRADGIGAGDRVGIRIPSGTADLYVWILAVLALGAAYVPVDAEDPEERAALVWSEAGVCAVIGPDGLTQLGARDPRGSRRAARLADDAWIIFTSGSTGRPKGVAVSHRAAAAFVDAEARLFLQQRPLGPGDRVLAGLSVAFDASCEEMWLAWRHGACLVPAPRPLVRSGHDLAPWLAERGITVISTVPTLAALWPVEHLRDVRLLILGGEACPPELADRLAADSREVWNTYGPTETTVVATAAPLVSGAPVRIGLPLDGWLLAVVDEAGRPVSWGGTGELVIGGVGLARYLDPVKDAEKYPAMPALGWDRAYRSGDLVRAERAGLVFVGRADEQVKLAGRRIELGEVDAALTSVPWVAGAAAAVRDTPAGGQLLVGYVVLAQDGCFDAARARELLAGRLPAELVPLLVVVAALPTRTSGKVDRDALPWPVDLIGTQSQELTGTRAWLAARWTEVLGLSVSADADFFALGGTSLAAAQLVSLLRREYGGVSVADVYRYPALKDFSDRLDELGRHHDTRRDVRPTPTATGIVQLVILVLLRTITGLRWVTLLAATGDVLGWPVQLPWWLLVPLFVVLFTAPGRTVLAAGAARALLHRVGAGTYRRGGPAHLRLWTAEQVARLCGMGDLVGTPWINRYAALLGCRLGTAVDLHTLPPVTGLAEFGDHVAVEPEADIAGWWLDGDQLVIGAVLIGARARVGARSVLLGGAEVGAGAEVLPGSTVTGSIPAAQRWGGSPARPQGQLTPGPVPAPHSRLWGGAYSLGQLLISLLPVLAAVPGMALILVAIVITGTQALDSLLWTVPLAVLCWALLYPALIVATVRGVARLIRPGTHRVHGATGWAAWLTVRLLGNARGGLFLIYASLLTPVWLRLLGARVGARVEASTVLAVPKLSTIADAAFLADDTVLAPYELRSGWLRLGHASVGAKSFLGNSAIVAGGRSVPDDSLVGVLSAAPEQAAPGSSWLGMPAIELPRVAARVDSARTFDPPARLVLARAVLEAFRLVPLLLSGLLGAGVAVVLEELGARYGTSTAAAAGGLVLLAAGLLAALAATVAKWLLVGRIRATTHPLWTGFVWRNELYDTFVEQLAVPWLLADASGTPLLTGWLRSVGARIGRRAWLETYWLPEPDLIEIGAGATVNRSAVVQTHLFHDRLMRLGPVRLGAGSTLGPHGIVLPNTTVESGATIGPLSLVMRGETVPASTRWLGNPIRAWTTD